MKLTPVILFLLVILTGFAGAQTKKQNQNRGVLLENLSWLEAEKVLTPETIIVIPLGAAAKEHGPHLPLNADWLQAEYFKMQVFRRADVVIAPTINYHYYPPFAEYPGSTSLSLETAQGVVVDTCRSLARYGPRRFYIINIGLITTRALQPAADLLGKEGIILSYTDLPKSIEPVSKLIQQKAGSHADEVETSIVLYMYPERVNMKKAVKEIPDERKGYPTRDPKTTQGTYLPSGVYGDATLATREKGRAFTEAIMETILRDIENLRRITIPNVSAKQ